jgi:hypothetical protein
MGKEEVLDLCATFMLVEDIDGLIERMEEFQKGIYKMVYIFVLLFLSLY